MSEPEETPHSSTHDAAGVVVAVQPCHDGGSDSTDQTAPKCAFPTKPAFERHSTLSRGSDSAAPVRPVLSRSWSTRVNPWQRPDFYQSYRDRWYCIPTMCRVILVLSGINALMLLGWSIYSFATLSDPGQELHLAITLLLLATAYIVYAFRAIIRENVVLLLAHMLLSVIICGGSLWWIVASAFSPAQLKVVTVLILLPTSFVTSVLEIVAMRSFGWRTYSRFAIDWRSADASLIRKLWMCAYSLVAVMYLLGLTTVIMSLTGIILFASSALDIQPNVAVPVLTLNTAGLVYQLAVQLAVYYCIRERSRHKYMALLQFLFALLYSIPIVNVVLMFTSVANPGDMTRAMIVTAVLTIVALTVTWVLVRLVMRYWRRLGEMDELPSVDTDGLDPVLLPLLQGAWLFRPGTVTAKRLRFFQLSADHNVLRWAWHEWVDMRYVDAVEVSDESLIINIKLTAEPDLLLKFPSKGLYRNWKQGLQHLLADLLGDIEMVPYPETPSRVLSGFSAFVRATSSSTASSFSAHRQDSWMTRMLSGSLAGDKFKKAAKVRERHFSIVKDRSLLFTRKHSRPDAAPGTSTTEASQGTEQQHGGSVRPSVHFEPSIDVEMATTPAAALTPCCTSSTPPDTAAGVESEPCAVPPRAPSLTPGTVSAAEGSLPHVAEETELSIEDELDTSQRTRHRDKLLSQLNWLGEKHRYWARIRDALPHLMAVASRPRSFHSSTSLGSNEDHSARGSRKRARVPSFGSQVDAMADATVLQPSYGTTTAAGEAAVKEPQEHAGVRQRPLVDRWRRVAAQQPAVLVSGSATAPTIPLHLYPAALSATPAGAPLGAPPRAAAAPSPGMLTQLMPQQATAQDSEIDAVEGGFRREGRMTSFSAVADAVLQEMRRARRPAADVAASAAEPMTPTAPVPLPLSPYYSEAVAVRIPAPAGRVQVTDVVEQAEQQEEVALSVTSAATSSETVQCVEPSAVSADQEVSQWSNQHSDIYGDVMAQLQLMQQQHHQQHAGTGDGMQRVPGTGPGPPFSPFMRSPLGPSQDTMSLPPQQSLPSPFQGNPFQDVGPPPSNAPSLHPSISEEPTTHGNLATADSQPASNSVFIGSLGSRTFGSPLAGTSAGSKGGLPTGTSGGARALQDHGPGASMDLSSGNSEAVAGRALSALDQLTGRAVSLGLPMPITMGQVIYPEELGDPDTWTPLGHGAQGQVFKARMQSSRKMVAVKCFTDLDNPQNGLVMLHEIEMNLRAGKHPNVVQCLGLCSISDVELLLVLEFCPRSSFLKLIQGMQNKGGSGRKDHIDPPKLLKFMRSVAAGVCHLHSRGILHRDIKPGNCFIDIKQVLKLGDLGHSCQVYSHGLELLRPGPGVPDALQWGASTAEYSAPETWHKLELTTPIDVDLVLKADVYSFGVMLWQTAMLRSPYDWWERNRRTTRVVAANLSKQYDQLRLPPVHPPPGQQPKQVLALYNGLAALVEQCTQVRPQDRPNMAHVLQQLDVLRMQYGQPSPRTTTEDIA